ncbi:centrosomal protein of 95 kDa isoform X2 [Carassius auratus]|uniref:Centrosomal protein of 95 kDa isoform X2 n=1 Tax=Carassius auratus TaxID=7957 RepID=A0A6P6PAB5_CARAU|nr:centrosomal protein of 95 kDa isoform X2 [Carassius auratus]XP_052456712.1 centrosomal protein of 95 kDa isoform X2 [Carassius gibelio]
MGPEERDWLDMANNVLLKCHINLRLERISECDANVFVALYEAIIGEKVPDYVAAERQEDDIHNMQSVIDSLALDYLQISLSHITGENIVRGEKESVRNLLEIFDGLLDYLIDQQSDEEPQLKGFNGKTNAAYQSQNQDTGKMQCQPLTIQLRDRDGSLYLGTQRNKEAEQELHDMSEKLSRRLEELDLMLQRALSEIGEMCEPGEEDKQSHHSDSIMECFKVMSSSRHSRAHAHSLPPFPSHVQHTIQQDALTRDSYNASHNQQHHRNTQFMESIRKDELKQLVQQEQTDITTERLNVQKTELEYHQEVCRNAPSVHSSCTKSPCSRSSGAKLQHTARKERHSVKLKDNNLLPILLEEFQRVQLSPHTLSCMWKQQLQQIDQLSSSQNQNRQKESKLLKQLEEAQKRHGMLVQIIHKEKEHNRRLREFKERIQQQKSAQNKLREQRQQVARAKKYYSVYHVQLRARLMQAKTQEERKLKQIFEEGLELQKARLREQRAYSKELRQENYHKFKDEIEAMENYYRDQALQKMKRELRNKMEKEIGELQNVIIHNEENNYFRDLDVERLQKRVQMASFQYTTSCQQ